ncbi:MFS general substrate transporter [Durotheca rogersii]|uniref:MFS general substrate transporter n=1 Tax=Durotheca rogersii TaxID=419775 RepID=UPI002220DF90|nr:MFS general substrate transporter [Durotheca rogersii]KAI5856177.1 MFS general substrate transporter [Durotheca rogersii]
MSKRSDYDGVQSEDRRALNREGEEGDDESLVDSDKESVDDGDVLDLELGIHSSAYNDVDAAAAALLTASPPSRARATLNLDTGAALPDRRQDLAGDSLRPAHSSQKVVAWRDLPRKKQLVVITLARLSEPLVQTSLQAYMFYQLQWFESSLPDSVIASQAGILHASFTAAQFFTAMLWGRVADSTWAGRKTVILIGLLGTLVSVIGYGFSTKFYQALLFRCLGGATNGNVGVMRTMISEVVHEKKYQSRAFLLLPMTFNIGVIIGPILGGILSDPAGSYPDIFGNMDFFLQFPYAAPNLVSAGFLLIALVMCWLFLEETHDALRGKRDLGIIVRQKITSMFKRQGTSIAYTRLRSRGNSISTVEMSPISPRDSLEDLPPAATQHQRHASSPGSKRRYTQTLPFRRIFTWNVTGTLITHFFLAFHIGTFNSLWFVFLSTPVYDPANPDPPGFVPHLPFRFTGGLGLQPRSVGIAMAVLGVIGITLQLFLYPRMSSRLGTLRSYRLCLFLFPVAYALVPFLSLVPSASAPPSPKSGWAVWAAIAGVLLVQVTGRTFALPGQTILVNNCTPHPSVLGTVHGLGQSVSSFARTVGPALGGWLYGLGLSRGLVGGVFWGIAAMAACGLVAGFGVREGDGHEIWLGGDEAEDEGLK